MIVDLQMGRSRGRAENAEIDPRSFVGLHHS